MKQTKRLSGLVALLVAAIGLSGCGTSSDSGEASKDKLFIGALLPETTGFSYTASYAEALKAKAEKLGVEVKIYDANYSASTQASQADELFAQKPDGVILTAAADDAAGPIIAKANALNIPISISNSNVSKDLRDKVVCYTGPDNRTQGEEAAALMAKALNETGGVGILGGAAAIDVTVQREAGFRENLQKVAPGMKVLASQPTEWDKAKAISATTAMLTKYGDDLNGIFAMSDDLAAGAAQAVQAAGKDPKDIPIIGVGFSESGQTGLKSGALYGTILQSARTDGEYAIEYLVKSLKGEKLSDKQIFIPMPQVTSDNMGKYKPDW